MTYLMSTRQTQILALVAEGMTNGQIGKELGMPVSTVSSRLRHLYRRIGANDRAHAVLLALRAGVLT